MNDFEKIEHLLLSKKFEELSPTEVKEVNGYFENATDYNDMRDTLMQVKSTLAADKLLIKPNVELKEKLLQKFDNTSYTHSNEGLGKRRPFYKNIAFQWSAAASVVIVISLSIFGYIQNMNSKTNDGMAVNYPTSKNKKEEAPSDERTITPSQTFPTGAVGGEESKGKDRVTTINPEFVSTKNEDELGKTKLYSNFYAKESSEITVDDVNITQNAPMKENENSDIITIGSNRNDNTTLGETEILTNKERKDNADYYYNEKITTNAYRQNDQLKDKEEEDKKPESNTTIPIQSLGVGNTTIDYKQKTTKKEYWSKSKNKNKSNNRGLMGGLEATTTIQNTDSTKIKLDSLKLDSNRNLLDKDSEIQMNDNKKED